MKKNTMYWFIGALALVGVGGFLWMNQNSVPSSMAENDVPTPVLPSSSTGGTSGTGYNPPAFGVNAGSYYGIGTLPGLGMVAPRDPYDLLSEFAPGGSSAITVVGTGGIAPSENPMTYDPMTYDPMAEFAKL
jgi:hypothetical protein